MFSTFLFDSQKSTKSRTDRSGIHSHCAFVGYPTLIHETASSANRHTGTFAQKGESCDPSFGRESASSLTQNWVSCMQAAQEVLQKSGIPGKTAYIFSMHADQALQKHNTYVKCWVLYCHQLGTDPLQPTVIDILQFPASLYEDGKRYSSLNTVQSAISTLSLRKDTVGSYTSSANV